MKKKILPVVASASLIAVSMGKAPVNAVTLKGDVNNDSVISIDDAAMVLSCYANSSAGMDYAFSDNAGENEALYIAADVDENNIIDLSDVSCMLTYYARVSAGIDTDWSDVIGNGSDDSGVDSVVLDGTLSEDGDYLTIACWTEDYLSDMYDIVESNAGIDKDKIKFLQVGNGSSGEAGELYAGLIASGEDIDIFFCDNDYALEYCNNDEYTAPLSAVGITEDMYANAYDYTLDMGKSESGVLKGASLEAQIGGYCYRTDLAEQYLGITSPEEMQAKVSDWDMFWETAREVYTVSDGITSMADTLGGFSRAYNFSIRKTPWVAGNTVSEDSVNLAFGDFISAAKTNYDAGYISDALQWNESWYSQGLADGDDANGTFGCFLPTWCLLDGGVLEQMEGGEYGSTYGKYNIVPGPSGWYWGGSVMCVSPNCDNATEAGKFIYTMTADEKSMAEYASKTGYLVNNKNAVQTIIDRGGIASDSLGGQSYYETFAENAERIDMSAMTEYDYDIYYTTVKYLGSYCDGTIDEAALMDSILTGLEDGGFTVE